MLNIEEIKAREQAATPGPWISIFDMKGFTVFDMIGEKGKMIARLFNSNKKYKRPDADFIAHARTDIPALIENNAAKDQQIATLKKALMQAIREGHTDLSPASHQKLFDHYVQAQEQEGKK
ncbi:hypothetical protein EQM14_01545 [Caproiciproducens sp. NJN-50]|uniref:hypothetical protein n=1 Tax=Caproiciproducens sp. NJN-50 TaxID=2507162 RepID=UPI000FFE22FB|nr:hypothetical protein [Caproiciproducens sp. NJN-50]QAT48568.1 hypothetical protein EQM14_01545 [Caproiciproducens sp. NJN-50]